MKSKKERLSTIRTESEFLDEYFASRIIGKSVPEIRAMVRSGELKGRIWSNEEVSVDTKDAYLTSRTMADLLLVEEQDVLDWIKAGEIYAKKTSDGYRVPYKEYSRFGQSGAWMKKCHDKMFRQFVKEINDGEIISEVNEGFKRGMKPHIDKAREVVDYLEKIHSEYQSQHRRPGVYGV